MYFDEGESEIRLYRSWTGYCIFRGKVEELPGGEHVITKVLINDAEGQYHSTSIDESIALVLRARRARGGDSERVLLGEMARGAAQEVIRRREKRPSRMTRHHIIHCPYEIIFLLASA